MNAVFSLYLNTRFSLMINFVVNVAPFSSPKFGPFLSGVLFSFSAPRPTDRPRLRFFRARNALRMHAFSAFGSLPFRGRHGMIYRVPSQICPTSLSLVLAPVSCCLSLRTPLTSSTSWPTRIQDVKLFVCRRCFISKSSFVE